MIKNIQKYIIRFSISLIFIIFGVWEFINPPYWSSFIPEFLASFSFVFVIIIVHGIILLSIGIWLASGYKTKTAAIFGTIMILIITFDVLLSSGFSPLFIRDFVITLIALSIIFEK